MHVINVNPENIKKVREILEENNISFDLFRPAPDSFGAFNISQEIKMSVQMRIKSLCASGTRWDANLLSLSSQEDSEERDQEIYHRGEIRIENSFWLQQKRHQMEQGK